MYSPPLVSVPAVLQRTRVGVDDVSIVPSSARIDASYEHRPMSSECWFCESNVLLLSNCKWGFPALRVVLTLDLIALVEEKTLRPSPGTTVAEMRFGMG